MILFLDFDGTTHPFHLADFSCLPRLENVLRDYPDVTIVISSMWRYGHSLDQLRAYFSEDIRARVIDHTPLCDAPVDATYSEFYLAETRHSEILMWLEQNAYTGPWVALDDSWREFPDPCAQLVVCHPDIGFDLGCELVLRRYLNR